NKNHARKDPRPSSEYESALPCARIRYPAATSIPTRQNQKMRARLGLRVRRHGRPRNRLQSEGVRTAVYGKSRCRFFRSRRITGFPLQIRRRVRAGGTTCPPIRAADFALLRFFQATQAQTVSPPLQARWWEG